jgi:hypothetical protein
MAVDVAVSDGGNVKNGTITTIVLPTGPVASGISRDYEKLGPSDAELLAKYGDRFDNPRYYSGDSSS